jgi:hypothetical protein
MRELFGTAAGLADRIDAIVERGKQGHDGLHLPAGTKPPLTPFEHSLSGRRHSSRLRAVEYLVRDRAILLDRILAHGANWR